MTESYQPHPTKPIVTTKEEGKADATGPSDAAAAQQLPSRTQKIDTTAIDGIRAIACVTIATNHWLQWFGEKKHGSIELQVRVGGWGKEVGE